MRKLNKLAVSIILVSLSPVTLINTVSAATVNGSIITYENETSTSPIVVQSGSPGPSQVNNLVLTNTNVTASAGSMATMGWGSAVSLGGNNGSLSASGQGYGDLTLTVDRDSIVTAQTGSAERSILYSRTDSPDAINTVNNAGTLKMTASSTTGRTIGILAENFGVVAAGQPSPGGLNVNLQDGSSIEVNGAGSLYGVLASSQGVDVAVKTDENTQITLGNTSTSSNEMVGIYAERRVGSTNNVFVENKGGITLNGVLSTGNKQGINASSNAKTDVVNSGNIEINGNNGTGIAASGATGSVITNGNINIDGANSKGVVLNSVGATVTDTQAVTVSGDIKLTNGGTSSGQAVVLNNGTQGAGVLTYDDADGVVQVQASATGLSANGTLGFFQNSTNGADVLIDIKKIQELQIEGNNAIGIGSISSGGSGDTTVNFTQGLINMAGNNADAINLVNNNVGGNITVVQGGDILITDSTGTVNFRTEGIYANKGTASGDALVYSTGNIDIDSDANSVVGISSNIADGNSVVNIDSEGKHIAVNSLDSIAKGISINAANVDHNAIVNVENVDYIQAQGESTTTAIEALASGGANASVIIDNSHLIKAESSSGLAKAINTQVTGAGASFIEVTDNVDLVKASGNGQAISASSQTGTNTVSLGNTVVEGGLGANAGGVYMESTTGEQQLTSYADISAENDQAIFGSSNATTTLDNYNKVTGYTNFSGTGGVIFNNQEGAHFVLQNFAGTATKSSIDNDFGTNGSFNNKGIISFSEKNNTGTQTVASFNNVANFDNAGVIDLTTNAAGTPSFIGNTLTVTNGGNGVFTSNGGSLVVNTQFDNTTGISDRLVVDNAVTGDGGATKVFVRPSYNSVYGILTGNGIEVITVNGTSSANAFALGQPVMNGIYQYGLVQGAASGGASSQSWFLRNWSYNPVIGAYLANQTAATEMFNQQLRDRLLVMPYSQDTSQLNTLWMRTKMTHGRYQSVGDSINNKNRMYMAQLGSDIGVWKLNDGNLHVGLMAGYGDYKNTSTTLDTRAKADSKVKGYNAGVYATWFQNDDANKGLYVDTWTQYGWFRNETNGKDVSGSKKYNSNTWSSSIETGYGIVLGTKDNLQWTATPQAQLTYNYYHADNLFDKSNVLNVTKSKGSGLVTRLGVRLQAKDMQLKHPFEPYVEANWINSNAKNQIDFNDMKLSNGVPHNRYEAKVGMLGNINSKLSVSAQVGGTWGDNKYREFQGQLNLNYKF